MLFLILIFSAPAALQASAGTHGLRPCSRPRGAGLSPCRCRPPPAGCTVCTPRSSTSAPGTGKAGSPPDSACCGRARSRCSRSSSHGGTCGLQCPGRSGQPRRSWGSRPGAPAPVCGAGGRRRPPRRKRHSPQHSAHLTKTNWGILTPSVPHQHPACLASPALCFAPEQDQADVQEENLKPVFPSCKQEGISPFTKFVEGSLSLPLGKKRKS